MADNVGVERTIRMGTMAFIDAAGKTRRADHGEVVRVHPDHVERFDRLNKPQELTPEEAPAEPVDQDDADDKPARPRRSTGTARKDS